MQWNGVRARQWAGVAQRVRGRVGNGRGMEARQGAMRIFGRYLSRHPRPQPGADLLPQANRSRPPRTPDARSGEAWAREKAGGVPEEVRARGRFAGSRIG